MNSWIPRKKALHIALLATIAGLFIYIFGIYSVIYKIDAIESLLDESKTLILREEKGRVLKNVLEENQESIETLRKYFIVEGDEVVFIETIEEVGRQAGISYEIASIVPAKGKNESIVKEDVRVRVNTKGSWERIMNFINLVERMPFGAIVERVSLDIHPEGGWSGAVEFIVFREKL